MSISRYSSYHYHIMFKKGDEELSTNGAISTKIRRTNKIKKFVASELGVDVKDVLLFKLFKKT